MRLIKFINKLWVTDLTFIPKKLTWILIENCCLGKLSFSLETTSSALFLAFVVCVMKANSETGFSFNKMSTFTRLVSYVDKNYGLEFENNLLIYRYIGKKLCLQLCWSFYQFWSVFLDFYLITGVFVIEWSVPGGDRFEIVKEVCHNFAQWKDHFQLDSVLVEMKYVRMIASENPKFCVLSKFMINYINSCKL